MLLNVKIRIVYCDLIRVNVRGGLMIFKVIVILCIDMFGNLNRGIFVGNISREGGY